MIETFNFNWKAT